MVGLHDSPDCLLTRAAELLAADVARQNWGYDLEAARSGGWRAARTLAELGELTARWLEGAAPRGPGCPVGWPAQGSEDLTPLITAASRAGLVIIDLQTGTSDGHGRNAALSGFASGEDFTALMTMTFSTSLTIVSARIDTRDLDTFLPAGLPGAGLDWGGEFWTRTEIDREYGPACHPAAIAALHAAQQVSLIDPQTGRNNILWPALSAFAARRAS